MQDRYSGDIGDFSKLSLLRALFSSPEYRIGLIWYLFSDENHNSDGRHISYLKQSRFKHCDDFLVKQLTHVIANKRCVKSLEEADLLPENTVYYSEPVDFYSGCPGARTHDKQNRMVSRQQWLADAVNATSDCNVVVLDPDNGLQIQSVPNIYQKKSGKYAFYYEVEELFKNKTVSVIYHHFDRSNSHKDQIKITAKQLKENVKFSGSVFGVRFQPYSPRAYFFLVVQEEVDSIRNKLSDYLNSYCGFGWDSFYEI